MSAPALAPARQDRAAPSLYVTGDIRRDRRTKAEMADLRDRLFEIVARDNPMTVRQCFYQAVVAGLVEKSEVEYSRTVARLLLEMRREGRMCYSWISDSTRWMRKPRTYRGLADFIRQHQRAYRRNLWSETDSYAEIWLEKEALAGVIHPVTDEYDVPLMVSKGFASESYLYEAAATITDQLNDGPADFACIYYLGDLDPSGIKISESIDSGLRRLCGQLLPNFDQDMLVFERVAVTEDQITEWNLPTRPTKVEGNRHARDWGDRPSVELDAIRPTNLRAIVTSCIEGHLDQRQLDQIRAVEREEREQLRIFGQTIGRSAS